ncbi:MAG: thermonuclease family protein [Candidatus Shapirobacteria bacterium]|jgi:endonuclease YncB( thermonuclease family)
MMTRIFLVISVILNLLLGLFVIRSQIPPQKLYTVSEIIDGDSIVLEENKQSIRLMNINAPEKGLCGYHQAKAELTSLLQGKQVKIVGTINDSHNRFLALVYLPDGTLVNELMLNSGWARYTSNASIESARLQKAGAAAKATKIGIFGPLCFQSVNPANPKCSIKGNVKDGKKTYFFDGCGNYSNVQLALDEGDRWFCSEAEALQAGFTKSVNCHEKLFDQF